MALPSFSLESWAPSFDVHVSSRIPPRPPVFFLLFFFISHSEDPHPPGPPPPPPPPPRLHDFTIGNFPPRPPPHAPPHPEQAPHSLSPAPPLPSPPYPAPRLHHPPLPLQGFFQLLLFPRSNTRLSPLRRPFPPLLLGIFPRDFVSHLKERSPHSPPHPIIAFANEPLPPFYNELRLYFLLPVVSQAPL